MAQKVIEVPLIGPVTFQKRRNTRSVRIHVQGSIVKVTLPWHLSYQAATRFVLGRKEWILSHQQPTVTLSDKAYIGKTHQLMITHKDISRASSRIDDTQIRISLPLSMSTDSTGAQQVITKACERALRQQCEQLVIPRLQDLAFEHGFELQGASVKRLRSRWGSCDTHKHIVLNSYLAQLPWPLIDYVLIHELAHTKHLNHSPAFWDTVATVLPDYKQRRKQSKQYSPHVITT